MNTLTEHPEIEIDEIETSVSRSEAQPHCDALDRMVGQSPALCRLRSLTRAVAARNCPVLIHGETGTGKELVASSIHAASTRAAGAFVPVDCTTLTDNLFESQLFGHARGAFTGAMKATLGFFRSADNGTLFLDEIGELGLHQQAKLLRCIQDRAVVPLGSVKPIPVNVRIVAATHRNLAQMVAAGTFRQDLFFRLNVVMLDVPALKDRVGDVDLLAAHFLNQVSEIYEEPVKKLSDAALQTMRRHNWPGNVRELANAVEHACIASQSRMIEDADLPSSVRPAPPAAATATNIAGGVATGTLPMETMDAAQRRLVTMALQMTNGNQTRAAQILDIDRRRMYRYVEKFGLKPTAA